jgi:hypothetical protein
MGRWQINEFMNPSKEVYFNLCLENLYDCEFEGINGDGIDRERFRDILVKYDLQQHTDWLIEYQVAWNHMQSGLEVAREKRESHINISRPYALKVAKILKMFLTGETREYRGIEISAKYRKEKIEVAGKDLFDQLKMGFIKEFERLGLNITELTTEEALEEIDNGGDWEWEGDHGYEADLLPSDPWAVDRYRQDHCRTREVTLEIVNQAISKIEMAQRISKKGAGAKVKNLGVGELAKRLSYLHRIRIFLNQNEFSSIKEIPLPNETCRFIYDYLEFWDSLPKGVEFETEDKEKRANYIKSLIRNNEKYFSKDFSFITTSNHLLVYDDKLEMKIDLFKKVKDGLITPIEYYERT